MQADRCDEMTRDELLERGDETVTLRQLVERFEAVEEEYSGMPWSLKQIYTQIDMLVSEKPKMGRWEWVQYDGNPNIGNWNCSECHYIGRSYFDYCPSCGAKMQEVEE